VAPAGAFVAPRGGGGVGDPASGVGAPQDLGDGPPRRASGDGLDGAADPRRRRASAQGALPARTPPARPAAQGCVRRTTDRTEPGLAAGLLRVRDHHGWTWRVGGIADYWSKYEYGWHWSPTANQFDAIAAVELAVAETERLLGHRLVDLCKVDTDTGELQPAITVVTDNGGPFKSFRFGAFITSHPALTHVRTKAKSPGQNGVRERAFGSLKYERLYLEPIDDPLDLVREAERFRVEFNTIRPHEALAWNRPHEVQLGLADPTIPNFPEPEFLPLS
jgi:transposase InsO family protein